MYFSLFSVLNQCKMLVVDRGLVKIRVSVS